MSRELGLVVMDSKVVVSSRMVAEVFGREHFNVLQSIKNLECSDGFKALNFQVSSYPSEQGKEMLEYIITSKGFTLLAMGFTGQKAMVFKEEYIEAFEAMEEKLKNPYAVKVPQSFPEALRAYANECEYRALAEAQRDEAIKTKAWIGTKREATAMATASAERRRAEMLAEQVGDSLKWKSVKSLKWILDYLVEGRGTWSAVGKKLTALSIEMERPIRKIEDSEFGSVNAYHVDVVGRLRSKMEADPNMLSKYRK